jgi:hypothetical protein
MGEGAVMVIAKNGFSECNTRGEGAKTRGEVKMGRPFQLETNYGYWTARGILKIRK